MITHDFINNQEVITATIDEYPGYVFYSDGQIWSEFTQKFLQPTSLTWKGYIHLVIMVDGRQKTTNLHILIARAFHGPRPAGHVADHRNRIKTDNRADNLRYITQSENIRNSDRVQNSSSQYIGVTKNGKKWMAQIGIDRKQVNLGYYDNEEEAARAYDVEAVKLGRIPNFAVTEM